MFLLYLLINLLDKLNIFIMIYFRFIKIHKIFKLIKDYINKKS